mgnify:CR=1 FL=1
MGRPPKLSGAEIEQIRREVNAGRSTRDVALQFDVSAMTISRHARNNNPPNAYFVKSSQVISAIIPNWNDRGAELISALPQPNGRGGIYFIGTANGPIKIGYSSDDNALMRMAHLQSANWEQLYLFGTFKCHMAGERLFHAFMSAWHIRGEWFERHAALSILNWLLDQCPELCDVMNGT